VVAAARRVGVDPASAATEMAAAADDARRVNDLQEHLVDTLTPEGPRTKP
jgi:hypothetical protein